MSGRSSIAPPNVTVVPCLTILQVIGGLVFLRTCNIVHGAIKPVNILVTEDGVVKIGASTSQAVFTNCTDNRRQLTGALIAGGRIEGIRNCPRIRKLWAWS